MTSKHTKRGRRARFRRWAAAWWFATGSDLAVVQAEAIRALGRKRYWTAMNAMLRAEPVWFNARAMMGVAS